MFLEHLDTIWAQVRLAAKLAQPAKPPSRFKEVSVQTDSVEPPVPWPEKPPGVVCFHGEPMESPWWLEVIGPNIYWIYCRSMYDLYVYNPIYKSRSRNLLGVTSSHLWTQRRLLEGGRFRRDMVQRQTCSDHSVPRLRPGVFSRTARLCRALHCNWSQLCSKPKGIRRPVKDGDS